MNRQSSRPRDNGYTAGVKRPSAERAMSLRGAVGLLLTVLLPPVGLFFLWQQGVFRTRGRVLLTGLATLEMMGMVVLLTPHQELTPRMPVPAPPALVTASPTEEVLAYGEKVKTAGLNLLSAPGNDLVASTALAASGAQIVLFSTGRGTPFACPVPTVKISSNSKLAGFKHGWIDFDAGRLLDGMTLPELSKELLEYVLACASGEKVCSERMGFHDLAIFKTGVTL